MGSNNTLLKTLNRRLYPYSVYLDLSQTMIHIPHSALGYAHVVLGLPTFKAVILYRAGGFSGLGAIAISASMLSEYSSVWFP